ncbi:hypothetical protein PFICI_00346 [Pestalotiopsis fici W106-1]|uniref:Protein SERAC1 n=1 Tax=Pestalotiopsis fici (strain W106-1 / CGMCC3.15140) TaxID=1229662 RepID=W3XKE1_PESFW|nr:uncharacterized protein PFICI_00346 [Pestalotiopsis fici W106-1]ETS86518.1 hypothetical protein PFICI_00346 [Pestalotiopsis fici W106-1]
MGVSELFEKFVKRTKTYKPDPKKPNKAFQTGLRDLFVPPSQDPLIDIVLIHDLTAGRDDSWDSEGSDSFWLAELCDDESKAHIAAFGYDAQECQVMDDIINHDRLKRFAEALLTACPLEMSQTNNDRPIIFVAHGFGGLVYEMACAYFLCILSNIPALTLAFERNRAQRRHAAVLLDTPHHGAGVAEWAIMCAKELGVPCANTAQEQDWSDWNESFAEIDATQKLFRGIIQEHMSIKIAGCFATKPIKETKLILSSEWAVLPEFRAFALGGTHLDMTKCRKDDAGCKMLLATLQRWSRDLTKGRIDHSDLGEHQVPTGTIDLSDNSAVVTPQVDVAPVTGAFDDDVVAQLKNRNWRIKLKAINELRHAPGLSEEILEIVARLLEDDDLDVRKAAAVMLHYHSSSLVKSVTFVVDYLKYRRGLYQNSQVVCGILNALKSQLDIPMEILQAIVEKLRTPSTDIDMWESAMIQESAINVLKAQPDLPTGIFQKLVDWFMVKHEEDLRKAIQDARTTEFPRKQMNLLPSRQMSLSLHAASSGDRHIEAGRGIVLGVLNIFKCQTHLPKDIVRAMAVRLEGKPEDRNVTKAILGALEYRLDLLPKEILPSIVARLKHKDFEIRQAAFKTLQHQSSLPEGVLQVIVAQLEDQDWRIREAAIKTFQHQLSLPEEVIQASVDRFEDHFWSVREAAIKIFQGQSSLPKEVLQAMVNRFEDQDWRVREAAIKTFQGQSSLPKEVLQPIVARFEDEHPLVREAAIKTFQGQSVKM